MITFNDYCDKLSIGLKKVDFSLIDSAVSLIKSVRDLGGTVYIAGNGGSAATASHMACDLGKGINKSGSRRLKVISLPDQFAIMSAYSNDVSYDDSFSEILKNFVSEGDLLIAISASGNSENVIRAVKTAKDNSAKVIGLLGFDGGKLKDMCDISIVFPEKHYGRAEDAHMIIEHFISDSLKE